MIARTWQGRVPVEHGDTFAQHLLHSGVADYHRQPGCARSAAVLYVGDKPFGLVPDKTVMHYDVVSVERPGGDEAGCVAGPAKQAAP
jgi:hypothetical protein